MTSRPHVLVLGASGRFGGACAKAFAGAGWRVIAQQRKRAYLPGAVGIETLVTGDAPIAGLLGTLPQIDVVVHAMNPGYTDAAWTEHVPVMMESAIFLAGALGATLMFPGNVYNFGAGMPALLSETTPQCPTTVKGRLRVNVEQRLLEANQESGLRAVVIRAGDFFGSGTGSWLDRVIASKLQRGTFTYPGPLDTATPWAYLPDLAQAFLRVAEQRQQMASFQALHFSGHSLTGRDWLRVLHPLAQTQGWVRPGKTLKTAGLPWPLIRALGLFGGEWASLSDVRYLFETPHALDNAPLQALIGAEPHNLQPWLVDLREPGVVTLYTDRTRVLPATDPFGRQILIGHGAFLELMVIALARQGNSCQVLLWPQGEMPADLSGWDDRPVARLVLSPEPPAKPYTPAAASLFPQILLRRTPKTPFDPSRDITAGTLNTLTEGGSTADVSLGATVDAARLPALRELCWQAGRQELLTPRTMMESQRLMRIGPEEILAHRDGIVLNTPWMRTLNTLGLFDRTQPPARGSAAYDAGMAIYDQNSRTATGFVWLSTAGNSRREQVLAGRAFARLQLKATELGVSRQSLQTQVSIDPSRIQLEEISMRTGAAPDLSAEERERLTAYLRLQLRQRVAEMPQNPAGRAAVIRAAITRVETVSPALDTVSTLFLLAPLGRCGL
jgi:nucleoside-diphosphate-sugar epimerase